MNKIPGETLDSFFKLILILLELFSDLDLFFTAVKEGNTPLVNAINKGLGEIPSQERADIERQWMKRLISYIKNENSYTFKISALHYH